MRNTDGECLQNSMEDLMKQCMDLLCHLCSNLLTGLCHNLIMVWSRWNMRRCLLDRTFLGGGYGRALNLCLIIWIYNDLCVGCILQRLWG